MKSIFLIVILFSFNVLSQTTYRYDKTLCDGVTVPLVEEQTGLKIQELKVEVKYFNDQDLDLLINAKIYYNGLPARIEASTPLAFEPVGQKYKITKKGETKCDLYTFGTRLACPSEIETGIDQEDLLWDKKITPREVVLTTQGYGPGIAGCQSYQLFFIGY